MRKLLFSALAVSVAGLAHAQSTIVGHVLTGTAPNANEYIGSSNGYNLDFKTNGITRMKLLSTGNFGVGITQPLTRLHVNGSFLVSSDILNPTSAPYIRGSSAYSTALTPDYCWWNNINTGLFHPAANVIGFTINGSEAMRIASNRYVGIGTSTPESMFHVHNGAMKITGPNPGGGPMILFGGTPAAAPNGEWGLEYTTAPIGSGYQGGMNFFRPFLATGAGSNYLLFLSNNGKIGVNTENPTAQLTVNGNVLIGNPNISTASSNYLLFVEKGILAEKVKVALSSTSDWADYVFAADYNLMPLNKVKTFVTQNKHLPGIPSAQQLVEDEGYDLGKMDAKLLEKIEELTLHMIRLAEENEALKARVQTLESTK